MSVAAARPSLTSNDASVLQALFDAESSPSSGVTINSSLPIWPSCVDISPADLASLKAQETEIVHKLQANSSPRQEDMEIARQSLDDLLRNYPSYPTAYANRAQVLRMLVDLKNDESNSSFSKVPSCAGRFQPEVADLNSRIFADLGQAIKLATPESPADSVSPTQAQLLADTHTHRGYLLLKAARTRRTANEDPSADIIIPSHLCNLSADQLEEMASHDFFFGGRFGSKIAQQLSVQTNPYAKMCGAIVKEAMRKELNV